MLLQLLVGDLTPSLVLRIRPSSFIPTPKNVCEKFHIPTAKLTKNEVYQLLLFPAFVLSTELDKIYWSIIMTIILLLIFFLILVQLLLL